MVIMGSIVGISPLKVGLTVFTSFDGIQHGIQSHYSQFFVCSRLLTYSVKAVFYGAFNIKQLVYKRF